MGKLDNYSAGAFCLQEPQLSYRMYRSIRTELINFIKTRGRIVDNYFALDLVNSVASLRFGHV